MRKFLDRPAIIAAAAILGFLAVLALLDWRPFPRAVARWSGVLTNVVLNFSLLGSVWVAVNYGGGAPWRWLALWFAFVVVVVSVLLAPHDFARSLFPMFIGD